MPFKPVDTNIKVILGPCVDDTDFKSREEGLTYDQAGMEIDVILEKADGTISTTAVVPTTAGNYDWVHTNQGYYELELIATGGASYNNDTEGVLRVVGYCTGVLPFSSVAYDIVPVKVYNSLVAGSDNLEVDAIEISGDATAANNAELAYDGTGFGFTNCTMPTTTTLTNANPTVGSIADGVWDEVKSGHVGTTTFGDLATDLDTVAVDVAGLDGAAMRGTDSAALASVCTEARLSELDAGTAGKAAAEVDIIKATQLGVNTWYVTKGGNDANSGKTWTAAFLTIGAAVTAAASGDAINIGAGTFSESVNLAGAAKSLLLKGAGKGLTIITSALTATLYLYDSCILRDISIVNTGTGIGIVTDWNVLIEDSGVVAIIDGITGEGDKNIIIRRCDIKATYDAIAFGECLDFLIEDSLLYTDSTYNPAAPCHALTIPGSINRGVVRNCQLIALRNDTSANNVVAVNAGGHIWLDRCRLHSEILNAGSSGNAYGINAEVGNALAVGQITSCEIVTANSGSGTAKDVVQAAGTVTLANTLYSRAKITGTVADLTQDAVVSDATRFLGASIAAILADTGTDGVVIPSAEEAAIADAVWDELTSGHTTVGSYGQGLQSVRTGTAQAGAAGTITLDASASAVDDFYKNSIILITAGTGVSQARTISAYTGSTKVAAVTPNWGTTPGATSVFVIIPMGAIAGASAPTAADVADAVWDEVKSGHTGTTTFGDLATDIDTIAGATAPTVEEIDTELTTNHGSGSWQRSIGTGASSKTYTVTDSVTGLPIDGVTVWVSSDSAGNTVLASGTTNASGVFTWYHDLAAGTTVYVWVQKSGYNPSNPDTETI